MQTSKHIDQQPTNVVDQHAMYSLSVKCGMRTVHQRKAPKEETDLAGRLFGEILWEQDVMERFFCGNRVDLVE